MTPAAGDSLSRWARPAGAAVLCAVITGLLMAYVEAVSELAGGSFWSLLREDDLPIGAVMIGLLLALAVAGPRLPGALVALPAWIGARPVIVSGGATLVTALLALLVYRNFPLSADEYAPLFQARAFAAGKLAGRLPPELFAQLISPPFHGYFFTLDHVDGRVVSSYWPGFALLLTPFAWLGVPWLCNPLIVGVSGYITWRLAREVFDSETAAGWALLFAIASPAFTLLGISYYSMSAHLLANLGFAWLLFRPTPGRCFLAGLLGGFALSLHNPFPHLAFALPFAAWLWWQPRRAALLAATLAGYVLVAGPLVIGWLAFRDSFAAALPVAASAAAATPAPAPAAVPADERLAAALGSILTTFLTPPDRSIVDARIGGFYKVWVWAMPLLVWLAALGFRRRRSAFLGVLLASALCTFFAYFAIRFTQGLGWGYRYFHPAWGVLPILAAAAFATPTGERTATGRLDRSWPAVAAAAALAGLLVLTPLHLRNIDRRIAAVVVQVPPDIEGRSLKVMHGKGYCRFSSCDLLQNDPFLRGNVMVMHRSPARELEFVARHFPGAERVAANEYGVTYRIPEAFAPNALPAR